MAIIHQATLTPSKLEVLTDWVPTQSWGAGTSLPLEQVGAYRFDDPDGEVGIESIMVRTADHTLLHIPLTYRGAPEPDLAGHLITTIDHSTLGRRWVYDGEGDPVYRSAVRGVIRTAADQADEMVEHTDGSRSARQPTITVAVQGHREDAPGDRITVTRIVDTAAEADDRPTLVGTWEGQPTPVVLVTLDV